MEDRTHELALRPGAHKYILAGGILILIAVLLLTLFARPERSAASYCKVYSQEKARLAKLPGDSYSSGVFIERVSNAGEIAKSYGRLANAAPDEIRKDVEVLQDAYKQLDSSPSSAISAGLGSVRQDIAVVDWTDKQCKQK